MAAPAIRLLKASHKDRGLLGLMVLNEGIVRGTVAGVRMIVERGGRASRWSVRGRTRLGIW